MLLSIAPGDNPRDLIFDQLFQALSYKCLAVIWDAVYWTLVQ